MHFEILSHEQLQYLTCNLFHHLKLANRVGPPMYLARTNGELRDFAVELANGAVIPATKRNRYVSLTSLPWSDGDGEFNISGYSQMSGSRFRRSRQNLKGDSAADNLSAVAGTPLEAAHKSPAENLISLSP